MKNFIPLLRADRQREMNEYYSRGYHFRQGKPSYNYVRKITIQNMKENSESVNNKSFDFEVRTNHVEPRFYITINGNENTNEYCVYLTFFEIYEIIVDIAKKIGEEVVTSILLGERNKAWLIIYTRLEFELKYFSTHIPDGKIIIPNSNVEISYENLFVLIALIQDKSNYYWSISTEENKIYSDGILRMLASLINSMGDPILEQHKWEYNKTICKYQLVDESYDYKYYLTQDELNNIMGGRNPSYFVNDEGVESGS